MPSHTFFKLTSPSSMTCVDAEHAWKVRCRPVRLCEATTRGTDAETEAETVPSCAQALRNQIHYHALADVAGA